MRCLSLALCLAAVWADSGDITEDPEWQTFQNFIKKYHRLYSSSAEVAGRFAIFKDNLRTIERRNAHSTSAQHGVTKFADLTPAEFKARYTGYRKSNASLVAKSYPKFDRSKVSSIDWRQLGAVTPVKDQGQCGSCWAFSATEQIESDYFLQYKQLLVLSPQQVVSCDKTDLGCNGGDTVTAYQYVHGAGGLDSESSYPYVSGDSGSTGRCRVNTQDFEAGVAKGVYVSQSAAEETSHMLQQVAQSPMSVCVDAETWQTYTGGIIQKGDDCGTELDHCVQVVGYNANQNYWLVRNSWGADWGNDGYIWVQQGYNNCGIANEATIVDSSKPTLANVQV